MEQGSDSENEQRQAESDARGKDRVAADGDRPDEDDNDEDEDDEEEDEDVELLEEEIVEEGDGDGGEGAEEGEGATGDHRVYLPGDNAADADELVMDTSAYDAFCEFTAEWPCLTFDILPDGFGEQRTTFPVACQIVTGTQAEKASQNSVCVMQVSNITRVRPEEVDDDEDEDEEDEEGSDPIISYSSFKHKGGINRLRVCPHDRTSIACWSDTGDMSIYDITAQLEAVEENRSGLGEGHLRFKHKHGAEGYGLDWSSVVPMRLATGACNSHVCLWDPREDGTWAVSSSTTHHSGSVEDIQWSPTEANVFVSCSVDQTIKVWDVRTKLQPALSVHAHEVDVNVMSWNRREQHLLLSGDDSGSFKVWDLRTFMSGAPQAVAEFKWHTAAITSLEWHPTDASVLAVSGADNQVSLWDLAVEDDDEASYQVAAGQPAIPSQLLFIHQGQKEVKEVHWHAQVPGLCLSTAESGFNIFKTVSV